MTHLRALMSAAAIMLAAGHAAGQQYHGPQAPPLPKTNGMIRDKIKQEGERWELDGKDTTEKKGRGALAGDEQVPDDSKAPSFTLIGDKADTAKVRKELESSPFAGELMKKFLVQEFQPDNPLIRRAGFMTEGKPSIYAEMPDGRVLFRLSEYPGDKAMVETIRAALQVAEGVRKPQDGYTPAADPGLVVPIKPQVNAEVSPAPWTLILSHFAALVVGMLGGAGGVVGGGLMVRRVLSAAIAAELARAAPTPASSTPAAK